MASTGAQSATFISYLDLVLFLSFLWSVECLENISGTCKGHHYQKCENWKNQAFKKKKTVFWFPRILHVNIFQFGGGGKGKMQKIFSCHFFFFTQSLGHTLKISRANVPQSMCILCLRMAMLAQVCGFRANNYFQKIPNATFILIGNKLSDSVTFNTRTG